MKKFVLSLIIAINLILSPVAVAAECPLCDAAKNGDLSEVKRLLENGANVNAVNKKRWPALMIAANNGHSEVTKILLENGANVNARNKSGSTTLSWAAYQGHAKIARILLQCGANPDIKDKNGHNAWDFAKDNNPLVFAILKKHLNDVVQGRKFPPCDKAAANKQNPNQPESGGGIEAKKLPKETNIAERVFEKTWRSVVVVETAESQGSGIIIQPNVVATNCHVVENGNIEVYKAEERRTNRDVAYRATILKRDEANDFCLLAVDGLWGVVASIRKYETINIGEDVYALGAPKGLDLSLSSGLVSQLRQEDGERFIQTDTAISPGSSGGGLFDSEGNLIGILTKKIVDDDVEGIGFAIPADLAL